jgi:hypothetical protein
MPRLREPLQAIDGEYFLVKSDILAHTMTFSTSKDSMSNLVTIPVSRVREILAVNRNGGKVDSILGEDYEPQVEEPTYRTEEDSITRFDKAKKRKKKNRNRNNSDERRETRDERSENGKRETENGSDAPKAAENKPVENKGAEHKSDENRGGQNGENRGGHRNHHHHNRNRHHRPKQEQKKE